MGSDSGQSGSEPIRRQISPTLLGHQSLIRKEKKKAAVGVATVTAEDELEELVDVGGP